MTKLPRATCRQIMKEEGCELVSRKGLLAYREEVERYAYALANMANACAKHGNRKTILVEDIHLAIK